MANGEDAALGLTSCGLLQVTDVASNRCSTQGTEAERVFPTVAAPPMETKIGNWSCTQGLVR